MKVTIIKYLNVRVGAPSVNAPNYQYLAPGSVLEVDGKLYHGDSYDGNSLWYKDYAENYYWSGGVFLNVEEKDDLDQFQDIKVDEELEDSTLNLTEETKISIPNLSSGNGKGINIAVLDSGIDIGFKSLRMNIVKQKNYQSENGFYPHGTQVAGFLSANNKKLIGLCPESNLYDLRVSNDNGNIVEPAVLSALRDIKKWNLSADSSFCDIINLSLDIDNKFPSLQSCIDDLVKQGVIIIVAGTDGKNLNSVAKLNGVIPIGTFKKYRFDELKQNGFFNEVVINFLNKGIESTAQYPNYKLFKDSSAFAAIATGLVSKYLSTNNISKPNRRSKVLKYLMSIAVSIQNEFQAEKLKPYIS